jgi:hypothetical protein
MRYEQVGRQVVIKSLTLGQVDIIACACMNRGGGGDE